MNFVGSVTMLYFQLISYWNTRSEIWIPLTAHQKLNPKNSKQNASRKSRNFYLFRWVSIKGHTLFNNAFQLWIIRVVGMPRKFLRGNGWQRAEVKREPTFMPVSLMRPLLEGTPKRPLAKCYFTILTVTFEKIFVCYTRLRNRIYIK